MRKVVFIMISLGAVLSLMEVCQAQTDNGLVAYYPLDGDASDMSGSGFDGTVFGGVVPTEDRLGKSGGALQFDGVNGYILIGADPSFPSWQTYSVSLWFLNDAQGDWSLGYGQKIIDKTEFYHDWYMSLWCEGPGSLPAGRLEVVTSEPPNGYGQGMGDLRDYRDGLWHHAVVIKNGTNGELWVDGALLSTSTNMKTVTYASAMLVIGYSLSTDHFQRKFWSGKIDEVRIYDRALSESEVQQLYEKLLSPVETIDYLAGSIQMLDVPEGISSTLTNKLDAALNALANENTQNDAAAINSLNAFINSVEAQRGKKLSEADADELVQTALSAIQKLQNP